MEIIADLIGITPSELAQIIVLALILLVGLIVLRLALRLTASLVRIGCFGIILIVAVFYLLNLFSGG